MATVRMNGPAVISPPKLGPASDIFAWSPQGDRLMSVMVARRENAVWHDGAASEAESWSHFAMVDPDFRNDPVMLLVAANACGPSWEGAGP